MTRRFDSRTSSPLPGRRSFLKGAGAVLGAAVASPFVIRPASAQSGRLIFATWGGSWEEAMRTAWFDPFTAETGIEVITSQDNSYGKLQSMVESGATEWDVVETNPDFQYMGAERDLLEPLDFGLIDRSAIMDEPGFVTDFSVPQVMWSRVLAWNTERLPQGPASYADLFDAEGMPGARYFEAAPNSGAFEAAMIAAGRPVSEVYPIDYDAVFAQFDRLGGELNFFDTNAQAQQYISDGTAAMAMMPDGRAKSAIADGSPVAIQYQDSVMSWSSMLVPRGAPNREAAMRLLAYTMTAEAQAAITEAYTYGPVVPAAFDLIPEERALKLSGGPDQAGKFFMANEEWWAANREEAAERLTEWRLL